MYNERLLQLACAEIEGQIIAMPQRFTSYEFYTDFERNYRQQYEEFIRTYTDRHYDRAHAKQIAHSQLMHTVSDRFHHLARKLRTVPNPKGGDMSEWAKV